MIAAFPLQWPDEIPRHKGAREAGQFRTTMSAALANAKKSLISFGRDSGAPIRESDIVFSSNVGGLDTKITDPGIALWFMWDGEQRCIPIDRYSTVAANLQAIHHIIEADRTKLRHGSLAIVRAAYKGFVAALPAPGKRKWREVMKFGADSSVSAPDVESRFKALAKQRHPDMPGGSAEAMTELNDARDQALKEVGNG